MQVQDSEVDGEEGKPPASCTVSGATRRELSGARHRRITSNKAKEVFNVYKYELEMPGVDCRWVLLPFCTLSMLGTSWRCREWTWHECSAVDAAHAAHATHAAHAVHAGGNGL